MEGWEVTAFYACRQIGSFSLTGSYFPLIESFLPLAWHAGSIHYSGLCNSRPINSHLSTRGSPVTCFSREYGRRDGTSAAILIHRVSYQGHDLCVVCPELINHGVSLSRSCASFVNPDNTPWALIKRIETEWWKNNLCPQILFKVILSYSQCLAAYSGICLKLIMTSKYFESET